MTDHIPVLHAEVISHLNILPDKNYIDATFGGGGHTKLILSKLTTGKVLAFDKDVDAIEEGRKRFSKEIESKKLILVAESYDKMNAIAGSLLGPDIAGVVMDLGLSSDQLQGGRGFSFLTDTPLDMRFDQNAEITAYDIVNYSTEEDLALMIKNFGEERYAKRIARSICAIREKKPLQTTFDLRDAVFASGLHKKPGQIHPSTRTFQAIRIIVNEEFQTIQKGIDSAVMALSSGGRLVVISFHSLEDRVVKNALKKNEGKCVCFRPPELCECPKKKLLSIISKKPIIPTQEEIQQNSRSRSAKLRVAQKI